MKTSQMKNLLFLFLFISFVSRGQNVNKNNTLVYIENDNIISSLNFIQSIQYNIKKGDNLSKLYKDIKEHAQNKGANCFVINSISNESSHLMSLTVDIYFGNESTLKKNSNYQTKTVYIISDENFNDKTYSFKINKTKNKIKSGTYYKYEIKQNEKVKINKGGFFGTTVKVRWEENNCCKFYSLSGFGLSDQPFGSYNGVGVSFTTGKINPIDKNYGFLLIQILNSN